MRLVLTLTTLFESTSSGCELEVVLSVVALVEEVEDPRKTGGLPEPLCARIPTTKESDERAITMADKRAFIIRFLVPNPSIEETSK